MSTDCPTPSAALSEVGALGGGGAETTASLLRDGSESPAALVAFTWYV